MLISTVCHSLLVGCKLETRDKFQDFNFGNSGLFRSFHQFSERIVEETKNQFANLWQRMLGVKKHLLNIFISRRRWLSYFDKLPPKINKGGSPIEPACACDVTTDKGKTTKCVKDGIPAFFPSTQKDKFNRIKMCDRSPEKRDLKWSDDLTDEDYELFMKPLDPEAHKRQKRSVNVISKENVTRYCAERLAETPVGKMCAKLGTNVQALVNVCASDLEVGIYTSACQQM